jgi:ribonuclease P protein component
LEGALFLLFAGENGRGCDRLGLVLPRRLGGASARNRMRRLLREAFRRSKREKGPRLDLLLLPRAEILERSSEEVCHELRERLRRLSARLARRPGAAARG